MSLIKATVVSLAPTTAALANWPISMPDALSMMQSVEGVTTAFGTSGKRVVSVSATAALALRRATSSTALVA